jgi:anthranilate phosphoribosyltransferase
VQARCLREIGLCFCFAIHHHPAMRHAAKARQSLGFPTIFNALGPLTNPAGATRQVMGVYDPLLVEAIARVQVALGCERAMIVHGRDGIDEISTAAPTLIAHVRSGSVRLEELDPASLGVPLALADALDAKDLDDAVRVVREVLGGGAGPARDIVTLNAAAALVVGEVAPDWKTGLAMAASAIDSGAASRTLAGLVTLSNEPG